MDVLNPILGFLGDILLAMVSDDQSDHSENGGIDPEQNISLDNVYIGEANFEPGKLIPTVED